MDPDTIRSLGSRIRMDPLHYCEGGSMIPVDLSANCEGLIYDPNGSTDMSGYEVLRTTGPILFRFCYKTRSIILNKIQKFQRYMSNGL